MVKERAASPAQLAFLYQTFAATQTPEEVAALMTDLCTIREVNEMATRLEVAKMLAAGESYLHIQETTGSSATTIARVSKCINHGAGGYRAVFGLGPAPRAASHPDGSGTAPSPSRRPRPALGGRPARRSQGPSAGNQVE